MRVGVPPDKVAGIDAANPDVVQVLIAGVLRPFEVFGGQAFFEFRLSESFQPFIGEIVPVITSHGVFQSELGGEFDEVIVGIHARQIHVTLLTPED